MRSITSDSLVKPRLSVVTVTFNAEAFLEKTLESIRSQSFGGLELIIVDGKSTDSTLAIADGYSDIVSTIISEPDTGIYDAMNKGLRMARGEFVQFLNAGDYYSSNDVLHQVFECCDEHIDLLYGDIFIEQVNGKVSLQTAGKFTTQALLERGTGVLCHQSMFVRVELAPEYDLRYEFKAELNWYFDLANTPNFRFKHLPMPIVNYPLGGFGHKYFIRNRWEWILVIANRFGWRTVHESRILLFLLNNSIYRYSWLYKLKQQYLGLRKKLAWK
jgi:glycosyltransferase involved in cell wall biosynthesis